MKTRIKLFALSLSLAATHVLAQTPTDHSKMKGMDMSKPDSMKTDQKSDAMKTGQKTDLKIAKNRGQTHVLTRAASTGRICAVTGLSRA